MMSATYSLWVTVKVPFGPLDLGPLLVLALLVLVLFSSFWTRTASACLFFLGGILRYGIPVSSGTVHVVVPLSGGAVQSLGILVSTKIIVLGLLNHHTPWRLKLPPEPR